MRAKLNDRISDVAMEIYSKRVIPLPRMTILNLLCAEGIHPSVDLGHQAEMMQT